MRHRACVSSVRQPSSRRHQTRSALPQRAWALFQEILLVTGECCREEKEKTELSTPSHPHARRTAEEGKEGSSEGGLPGGPRRALGSVKGRGPTPALCFGDGLAVFLATCAAAAGHRASPLCAPLLGDFLVKEISAERRRGWGALKPRSSATGQISFLCPECPLSQEWP